MNYEGIQMDCLFVCCLRENFSLILETSSAVTEISHLDLHCMFFNMPTPVMTRDLWFLGQIPEL